MTILLLDCDNFFASCERVMQPVLANKPVAVLSNNDGCVIARTNEVKAAGVRMGQPYHECKQILRSINGEVFSANFLLYRHFAKRLQGLLKSLPATDIEVYSIDESFLIFDDRTLSKIDVEKMAIDLRATVAKWIGLPVSIGIGPSRSLAKTAAYIAKRQENHIFKIDLNNNSNNSIDILKNIAIEDVWGVGRKLAPNLRACGINNVSDLTQLSYSSPEMKLLNKTSKELIAELCGLSKIRLNTQGQKSIMHTRSFGEVITDLNELRGALAGFVLSLATKLRRKRLVVGHISLFISYRGNTYEKYGTVSQRAREIPLTNDSFALESIVDELVNELYVEGRRYIKAGIVLTSLRPAEQYQLSLEQSRQNIDSSNRLMKSIDIIADNYGLKVVSGTNLLGEQKWKGKQEKLSPYNNSEWQSLPIVLTG